MSEPDPKTTLREFREYFARSYEANHKIAARIGVTPKTFTEWLTSDCRPKPRALAKLRAFLDEEAKRATGNGIRPTEHVPLKIVLPPRQLHYARLCPFCRKARGKIRKLRATLFQGVYAKVDFEKKTASISFDPDKASTDRLTKATADAGYPSSVHN